MKTASEGKCFNWFVYTRSRVFHTTDHSTFGRISLNTNWLQWNEFSKWPLFGHLWTFVVNWGQQVSGTDSMDLFTQDHVCCDIADHCTFSYSPLNTYWLQWNELTKWPIFVHLSQFVLKWRLQLSGTDSMDLFTQDHVCCDTAEYCDLQCHNTHDIVKHFLGITAWLLGYVLDNELIQMTKYRSFVQLKSYGAIIIQMTMCKCIAIYCVKTHTWQIHRITKWHLGSN